MTKVQIAQPEIERIVREVVQELQAQSANVGRVAAKEDTLGVFSDVNAAVQAASVAFREARQLSLNQRETIIRHMRAASRSYARVLAQEAVAETGLGRVEDKVEKNLLVADKTPGTESLQPVAWTGDHGLALADHDGISYQAN